jgi:trigger factor
MIWRLDKAGPEGRDLNPAGTLENDSQPEPAEAQHEHAHEGAEHTHDHEHEHGHEHEHDHQHGPVLNPECTREIAIDVPAEDVSKAFRNTTREYQKFARIPGFRPGKVPESVIKRRYAAEIRKDVIDHLLPERFNQAVREVGVAPVGQPQVTELTVEDGSPLHVKAVFEFIPDFSIEGYKDVTVPKPSSEVTEEEFEREIGGIRQSHATIEPVEEDRAIEDGDWVQITYGGRIEGEPDAAPVTGEDTLVEIGGKDTVEAFSSVLRGARPGQELKAEVIYPEDYAEKKLAGKTVAYEVEVKAIKKRTVPELDDDFAKEMSYESLDELKSFIRDRMKARKRRAVENETKEKLMAALADRFQFPVPESIVQDRIDARLDRGLRALAAQGMDPNQMRGLDFGRLRTAQRDGALVEAKATILLDRIANEENVAIDDDELNHQLEIAARQSGETLEALRTRLTADGGLARIREQLRREKTEGLLYERLPG